MFMKKPTLLPGNASYPATLRFNAVGKYSEVNYNLDTQALTFDAIPLRTNQTFLLRFRLLKHDAPTSSSILSIGRNYSRIGYRYSPNAEYTRHIRVVYMRGGQQIVIIHHDYEGRTNTAVVALNNAREDVPYSLIVTLVEGMRLSGLLYDENAEAVTSWATSTILMYNWLIANLLPPLVVSR